MDNHEISNYYTSDLNDAERQQQLLQQQTASVEPYQSSSTLLKGWFDLKSSGYLKGLLIGAGAAVVLGHPKIRKAIISGAVNTWDSVTGGVEELKEQIHDVRAEKNEKEN